MDYEEPFYVDNNRVMTDGILIRSKLLDDRLIAKCLNIQDAENLCYLLNNQSKYGTLNFEHEVNSFLFEALDVLKEFKHDFSDDVLSSVVQAVYQNNRGNNHVE